MRPPPELITPWHRKLYEKGWIAPHWPEEYGGRGANAIQNVILGQEEAKVNAGFFAVFAPARRVSPTEAVKQAYEDAMGF